MTNWILIARKKINLGLLKLNTQEHNYCQIIYEALLLEIINNFEIGLKLPVCDNHCASIEFFSF